MSYREWVEDFETNEEEVMDLIPNIKIDWSRSPTGATHIDLQTGAWERHLNNHVHKWDHDLEDWECLSNKPFTTDTMRKRVAKPTDPELDETVEMPQLDLIIDRFELSAIHKAFDVNATLNERGNRYGDFTDHAMIAQDLQDVMRGAVTTFGCQHGHSQIAWTKLLPIQKQALTVIADKIARILSGDPNYTDNWHDIQGYAKLVEDRLGGE